MCVSTCCKCNEIIRSRAICSLGKSYHPLHFTCQDCGGQVEPSDYYDIKDKVVCSECYLSKHAEKCSTCRAPIVGRTVVSMGRKWHEKCFRCLSCSKPLLSSSFYEVNGFLFCKEHFREQFSSRCAGCGEPIGRRAVVVLNTKWHVECFRCHVCCRRLSGSEFSVHDGRPLCPKCQEWAVNLSRQILRCKQNRRLSEEFRT
ncbi:paxillin homolog 1 [Drosophila serrata]|uniref:paxillin homolog 1 n=1 Tax=Drosophila serrata TaxID=7274 RepID=UPI000A1CF676|nr:paxillin homolog 1 [Drosophila serrata]